jgi:hypothetical protein
MRTSSNHTEVSDNAATESTRWRVRELYCQTSYTAPAQHVTSAVERPVWVHNPTCSNAPSGAGNSEKC